MSVEIDHLHKAYGGITVIDDLSTRFREQAISVLLGPSGCGKTTTLRCIAGLEQPNSGRILIQGQPVFSDRERINLPPEKRDLGMVFQSYAIWPHMTVFENVALPLKARGVPVAEATRRVDDTLALVGLSAQRERSATQLSGGQQQRVAIARCVASRPRLMLLDEPLSNLDAKLRGEMRKELKELQRLTDATMVFVTHDQEEAMSLADTIFLFRNGRIVQEAPPADIYRKPVDHYVASFLGKANLFEVDAAFAGEGVEMRTAEGGFLIARGALPGESARRASCLVRPEYWRVHHDEAEGLPGTIESAMFLGDRTEFVVKTPIGAQIVTLPGYRAEKAGDAVRLSTETAQIHLFAPGVAG